jgi:nitroreductase
VVKNPETKKMLADATWLRNRMYYVEEAPFVIVGCGVPNESLKFGSITRSDFFYEIDVTIALQTMVLTAKSMGLGTCWVGGFEEEKVKEILGIPKEVRVIGLMAVGYPDENPAPRARKNLNDIIYYEQYGKRAQYQLNTDED